MQIPRFYTLILIISALFSTSTSAHCNNASDPVPEGPFRGKKCIANICHAATVIYHQDADRLELTHLVKTTTQKSSAGENDDDDDDDDNAAPIISESSVTNIVQEMYLDRACALIKTGFSIDLLVHSDTIGEFILIPPAEEDIQLGYIREYPQEIKAFLEQLDSRYYADSYLFSCAGTYYLRKADLLFSLCSRKRGKGMAVAPFSQYIMTGTNDTLILQNISGKLEFYKLVTAHGKRLFQFSPDQEIEALCHDAGMRSIKTPHGTFCDNPNSHQYLSRSAKHHKHLLFLVDNSPRDFAIAMSRYSISTPALLTGIGLCFSNDLQIGYNEASHRLYCTPDLLLPEMPWEHTEL